MNRTQRLLISIAAGTVALILFAGAFTHAYYYGARDYDWLDALSKDVRVYIAILESVIVGFFVLRGKNENR